MNHAVLTEHLADYLEGDLALDKRALVDAHLDGCAACAQEVREMQQTIRLLRAMPQPEVPPMIAANVMRRIRAGETQPTFLERVQRALGGVLEPNFVLPASAIAVAALVVVVVQEGGPLSRSLGAAQSPEAMGVEVEAGLDRPAVDLVAESDDVARGVADEVDRGFGASAVETAEEAPRGMAARIEAPAAASAMAAAGTVESSGEAASGAVPSTVPSAKSAVDAGAAEDQPARALAANDPMAVAPWGAPRPARARAASPEAFFGSGGLAQGFASGVAGPATGFAERSAGEGATAVPVTLSRRMPGRPGLAADAGSEDPRDVWLARALEHPAEFARYIARHNLAEQELWVARLGERAQSRGLLGELIEALRAAGDEKATWLADDFAAQADPETKGVEPTGEAGGAPLESSGR
ncbi:MAG: anti-sigma factor [Myxococcota bacterium]